MEPKGDHGAPARARQDLCHRSGAEDRSKPLVTIEYRRKRGAYPFIYTFTFIGVSVRRATSAPVTVMMVLRLNNSTFSNGLSRMVHV